MSLLFKLANTEWSFIVLSYNSYVAVDQFIWLFLWTRMMMMTEMQKKYDIGSSLTGFMEYVYCNLMTLIIFYWSYFLLVMIIVSVWYMLSRRIVMCMKKKNHVSKLCWSIQLRRRIRQLEWNEGISSWVIFIHY